MTAKATEPKEQPTPTEKPECFVIMPISDREGYEPGHFKRVYDWIIKPACEAAGYRPVRGDDVSSSHLIVADILKRIVEAPMAICDVSSLNANVMFELGIRQAFGKPVALMKDERTDRVFDISGLRSTDYSSSLRADLVKANATQLATMIKETGEADSGMTSLMSLVDIDAATVPQSAEVSDDSKLILQEIRSLSNSLNRRESNSFGKVFEKVLVKAGERWSTYVEEQTAVEIDQLTHSGVADFIDRYVEHGAEVEEVKALIADRRPELIED